MIFVCLFTILVLGINICLLVSVVRNHKKLERLYLARRNMQQTYDNKPKIILDYDDYFYDMCLLQSLFAELHKDKGVEILGKVFETANLAANGKHRFNTFVSVRSTPNCITKSLFEKTQKDRYSNRNNGNDDSNKR